MTMEEYKHMKIISELDEIKKKDAELKERESLLNKREQELSKEVLRCAPSPSDFPFFLFAAFILTDILSRGSFLSHSPPHSLQDVDNNQEAANLLRRIKTCPAPKKGSARVSRVLVKTDPTGLGNGDHHLDPLSSPRGQTPLSPPADTPLTPSPRSDQEFNDDLLLDHQVGPPRAIVPDPTLAPHFLPKDSPLTDASPGSPTPMSESPPAPKDSPTILIDSSRLAVLRHAPELGESPRVKEVHRTEEPQKHEETHEAHEALEAHEIHPHQPHEAQASPETHEPQSLPETPESASMDISSPIAAPTTAETE